MEVLHIPKNPHLVAVSPYSSFFKHDHIITMPTHSLHFYLVQRVLRRVLHGDSVQLNELEARGLYLSRQTGGYVCHKGNSANFT